MEEPTSRVRRFTMDDIVNYAKENLSLDKSVYIQNMLYVFLSKDGTPEERDKVNSITTYILNRDKPAAARNEPHFDKVNAVEEDQEIQDSLTHETQGACPPVQNLSIEEKIQLCIILLMNERILVKKNGKLVKEPLFNLQNHWQAIYRILVDKQYCKDSDFDGFDLFIKKVMPSEVNAPYKKSSVKQISQTDFNKPFEKWKYDPQTSGTLKPYERMIAVAQRFLEILEEKGL